MDTIQQIASHILAVPQDLSDLKAGDQVVVLFSGPNDWYHPLLSDIWKIDEADEMITFVMASGPDYKRFFDRQGRYIGCSWDEGSSSKSDFAKRRLYRISPEMEYLRLWRKLYEYIGTETARPHLGHCSNAQMKQLHRAFKYLDPCSSQSALRPMTVHDVLIPCTNYQFESNDSLLLEVLSDDGLRDLGHVRVGMYLVWAHIHGYSCRLGRIKVTRTTKTFIWIGEPAEARKFDREGLYRNRTHLDAFTCYLERKGLLLLFTAETKRLLVRQQLLGDIYERIYERGLIRKLPVEEMVPLYQILKTFPHAVTARQDDGTREREIEQGLARLSLQVHVPTSPLLQATDIKGAEKSL